MAEDPLAMVRAFLDEQCLDWRAETGPGSRGNHQGIRALGQAWQAWLLLRELRAAVRAQWNTPWLKERLRDLGYKIANYHGSVVVCDLTLSRRRPALPSGTHGLISELHGSLVQQLPPEMARYVPLLDATSTRRPPDEEIIRRFLADCCECEESRPRLSLEDPGDAGLVLLARRPGQAVQWIRRPRSPYTTRAPFLSIAHAFAWWLAEQGARPSLQRYAHSRWLKRSLVRLGYEPVHSENGLVYLGGIVLKPAIAAQVPERPRQVKGRDGAVHPTATRADRAARYQRYLARKEYAARLAAGFPEPVAREAFSLDLVPSSPAALAKQEVREARTRLDDAARRYVQNRLIADPDSVLSLSRLGTYFRAFLFNHHIPEHLAAGALREALSAAGAIIERAGKAKKGSPLQVRGFRYRVSSADVENQDHSREVVGHSAGSPPFD